MLDYEVFDREAYATRTTALVGVRAVHAIEDEDIDILEGFEDNSDTDTDGSSVTLISDKLAKELGLVRKKLSKPKCCRVAIKGEFDYFTINEFVRAMVSLANDSWSSGPTTFPVAHVEELFDVILGIPFIKRNHISLSFDDPGRPRILVKRDEGLEPYDLLAPMCGPSTAFETLKNEEEEGREGLCSRIAAINVVDLERRADQGNLAELLLDDGVKAWLASAMLPPPSPRSATLDSGTSHTMCGDASLFANLRRCKPSPLCNGRTVTIKNALLVEGLSTILISSGQLWDLHGVASHFAEHATLTRNGTVVATGSRTKGSLYLLDGVVACPPATQERSLRALARSGQVTGLKVEGAHSKAECNICQAAHATRLPFSSSDSLASHPLELVHSNVLSVDAASLAGKRYAVTFVDNFSRRLWVEPLDRKSDVFEVFKRFKAAAETESGRKLQHRSDNGGEYSSRAFRAYLDEHGVAFESPPPYSPASNGVAECVNRSILEGIHAMLLQAGANKSLWAEALLAFVFFKNRSPHATLNSKVPLTVWRGRPVRVDMLRV
ncbi:hypothetical protein JCM1841_004510 [Sporobolomyces salmonicolor]